MDIKKIGEELAKCVKTQTDLSDISEKLIKIVLETDLNANTIQSREPHPLRGVRCQNIIV